MASRIEDYALIGDMQTAALVSRDGSIDWLCLPRFDSDACFAALLGDERNGQWRIAPTVTDGPVSRQGEVTRQYQGDSLILQTRWHTMSGVVRVIDFMPPRTDAPVIVRIVEGVEAASRWRPCCGSGLPGRPGRSARPPSTPTPATGLSGTSRQAAWAR